MDDSKIIELFYAREEQAIMELSKKYGSVCNRVADNILNNKRDAEECVNDAYLGAWNTIPPQNPNPLLTYVCRIVRNIAINKYHANTAKKRNSHYDVALDELEGCFPDRESVEETLDVQELTQMIDAFLETLPREKRVLFVRRYWYGDSVETLANYFSTSNHNISVRLSRIREKLKKHLVTKGVSV